MQITTLQKVIDELKDDSTVFPAVPGISKIPTLKKGFYHDLSPQLKRRFATLGGWIDATHGDWLSINEMEQLVNSKPTDNRLKKIQKNLDSARKHWQDDAAALFLPERLSYFAASPDTSERIYLVWFDFKGEPELCVYDTNGQSRYFDLEAYLVAYLNDDLSAVGKLWALSQP